MAAPMPDLPSLMQLGEIRTHLELVMATVSRLSATCICKLPPLNTHACMLDIHTHGTCIHASTSIRSSMHAYTCLLRIRHYMCRRTVTVSLVT